MKNKTKRNLFQEYMDFIDRIVKWLCIGLMLFMLIVVLFQVISRKIPFIGSFSWTEELARYLMLWLVFLGSSHIAEASSYIRVTFLVREAFCKDAKGAEYYYEGSDPSHIRILCLELLYGIYHDGCAGSISGNADFHADPQAVPGDRIYTGIFPGAGVRRTDAAAQ